MTHIHSFPPIVSSKSRTLILGSMPSKVSIELNQYYGHPRNNFWKFIQECIGVSRDLDYTERVIQLKSHSIALWDAVKICTRTSSLDSDIIDSTVKANAFNELFKKYPKINKICFNGAKSESIFFKHVMPTLAKKEILKFIKLPSTSPANASIPLEKKLNDWKAALSNK